MKLPICLFAGAAMFVGLLLSAGGCRPNPIARSMTPEERAAAEQRALAALNRTFGAVETALAEGQTNKAIAKVEEAYTNHDFAAYRPQILEQMLQLMLRAGRIENARQRACAASTDPVLSAGACVLMYHYYRNTGDMANALAWSAELAARPGIPPDMRRQAIVWNIDDHFARKEDDPALAMLGNSFRALGVSEGMTLVRNSIETLLGAGRFDTIEQVLAVAARSKAKSVEVSHLSIATHVRISAARSDWTALTNGFPTIVNTLQDGELDSLLRAIVPVAAKADKRAVVDQCAETILFSPSAAKNPAAVATAARVWGESAMESDKNAFPGRLETMLRAKVPAAHVIDLFLQFYYSFTEQPVQRKELMALGDRLAPLAQDADTRNDIKVKVLDGCFLEQDFDRALSLLEAGIPGPTRNEQWHTTAIVKVKAHRALQRNEPREAVKYFREFMKQIREAKDPDVSDPVTGLLFPKELVLGRNAKRIGDILAAIPDPAESAKAYAEAREFYKQALANTKDADALKVIEADVALVPKAGGK